MTTTVLLLVALALGAEPDKINLPARVVSLSTDPAHVQITDKHAYISGFHSRKLVKLPLAGKRPPTELRLDAYENYRTDPVKGEVREIRRAAGGDLVLADGKIFVGQVFQGSILVVDQETFTPVKRLPIGGEGCLAASKDGKTVYFANNKKSEFSIIDTKTYKVRTVAYPPGGRGIGCMATSPNGRHLYLGIQRGGQQADGTQLSGGNCFLAVYDLVKQTYTGTVYLAQKRQDGNGDDAIPTSLTFSPKGDKLYIGMFQSEAGVQVVDTKKLKLTFNISFYSNFQKPGFPWVDPTSTAYYDRWLLVAIRHNQEVAIVDPTTQKVVAKIKHREAVGLEHVVVRDKQIYLYAGSSKLSIVDGRELSKLLAGIDLKKTGVLQVTLKKK